MKKTMPPTFHRILTTTALCLAAGGLGLMFRLRGVSPELGVALITFASNEMKHSQGASKIK